MAGAATAKVQPLRLGRQRSFRARETRHTRCTTSHLFSSACTTRLRPLASLRFFVSALSLSFSRLTSTWTWRYGRLSLYLFLFRAVVFLSFLFSGIVDVCFGARVRTVGACLSGFWAGRPDLLRVLPPFHEGGDGEDGTTLMDRDEKDSVV